MKIFHKRISVDEALEILFSHVRKIEEETIPFSEGLGRVLFRDVVAEMDIPPFDRASMDGYAIKGANTFGATQTNPITFRLVGEIYAGEAKKIKIQDFEAVKIATGAPMPEGADAVVMAEYARESRGEVEILAPVSPGKNVSRKGEDVRRGDLVLKKGRVLKPPDVGMLAALGKTEVSVFKKPEVAVISTGDELIEPWEELKPGKIRDINSFSLSSLIHPLGIPHRMGIVGDDEEGIKRALMESLRYDVVVISGSSSVGEKDYLPVMVEKMGNLLFHGVSMRPGEPTGFGIVKDIPVFIVPGHPVAAIISFFIFIRPFLCQMQELPVLSGKRIKARLKRRISSELGRRDFVRVELERMDSQTLANPIRSGGSGILSSMVKAQGFVIVPENEEGIEKGEEVIVELM
ncbi:MAG: molybdopterin molybdotransferase MoeA [Candidatus Syntropharchaeia archaeon]